jgi:hypothetical protein
MSEEPVKGSKDQLAIVIGRGASIVAWARANEVPKTTAFRWAKDPDVKKEALSYRRRVLDRVVGRMTKFSDDAVDTMRRISKDGDTDAVQLKAARALISDMISLSKYSGLEERMTGIEERLDLRDGAGSSAGWSQTPTNYGYGNASPASP